MLAPIVKKPRICGAFDFKPYTFRHFQETNPKIYKSMGGLGAPHLGTDMWKEKKSVYDKKKEYAKQVEETNKRTM
jgi:hypothetical protein